MRKGERPVLYTIYPIEFILAEGEGQEPLPVTLDIGGRQVLASPQAGPGGLVTFRLERLLSTNPYDYLLPQYQPGHTL